MQNTTLHEKWRNPSSLHSFLKSHVDWKPLPNHYVSTWQQMLKGRSAFTQGEKFHTSKCWSREAQFPSPPYPRLRDELKVERPSVIIPYGKKHEIDQPIISEYKKLIKVCHTEISYTHWQQSGTPLLNIAVQDLSMTNQINFQEILIFEKGVVMKYRG